jgi:Sulfotransferase family
MPHISMDKSRMGIEATLDLLHTAMRRLTGLKLVSDLHERPTFAGLYPPLDPKLRRRLKRIREAGVLFIHIPKNAGMSVSNILYGDAVFHPTVRYYQRVAADIVTDLPSFAVWRNPVERFVSAYRYAQAGGARAVSVSRAFRNEYMAFRSLDDAIDHVEDTPSLFDVDHIFRPQFWYVANMAGRIGVQSLCMIEDLDRAVSLDALPGLRSIGRINESKIIDVDLTAAQRRRLEQLYPIDFAIHDSLISNKHNGLTRRRIMV